VERNNLPAPKVRSAFSKQFEVLETKQCMQEMRLKKDIRECSLCVRYE